MKRIFAARLALAVLGLIAVSPGLAQETTTYVYDALGRLVSTAKSGGSNNGASAAYSFDPAGNRTQVNTAVAASASNVSVTGGSAQEGSPITFTLSRSGNVRSTASVAYATTDGSATAGADYQSATGSVTFAPNETTKTINVTTYADSSVEGNENFSFNLSGATGTTIGSGSAIGTINDNVAPSYLSVADASAQEGNAVAFTVTRNGSTAMSVSVNYSTANGSAQSGSDYVASSGTLNFAPGETTKTISVATNSDPYLEGNETFSLTLSSVVGSTIGNGTATGTIVDVVPASSLSIGDASASEGSVMTFTVTRNGSTAMYATVNYASSNGSAQAGSDYTAVSGTLSFAPGETSKTISVTTNSDAYAEGNETFGISLSGASATSIGQGGATGTIIDVVPASTMSVSDASASEGSALTFTVTRSGSSAMYSSVNYSTNDGSATAGSDYTAVSGTLNFAPGETAKSVSVQALNDQINEATENFNLNIFSPMATAINRAQGIGSIFNIPVNHPPVAGTINEYIEACGEAYTDISSAVSDPDGDPIQLVSVSGGAPGYASVEGPTLVYYSAQSGYGGTRSVSYVVQDSHGAQAGGTIIYHINGGPGQC